MRASSIKSRVLGALVVAFGIAVILLAFRIICIPRDIGVLDGVKAALLMLAGAFIALLGNIISEG